MSIRDERDLDGYTSHGLTKDEAYKALQAGISPTAAGLGKLIDEQQRTLDSLPPRVRHGSASVETRGPQRTFLHSLRRFVVASVGLVVVLVLVAAFLALRTPETRVESSFLAATILSSHDDLSGDEAADMEALWFPAAKRYANVPARTLIKEMPRGAWGRLNAQEREKVQAAWLAYRRDRQLLNTLPPKAQVDIRQAFTSMLQDASGNIRDPILYREIASQQLGSPEQATKAQFIAVADTLKLGGVGALGLSRESLANSLLAKGWEMKAR